MENFKNFRGICFDKYSLDPVHFYSALGLEFLINMDTLLMIVSEIRESICHSVLLHDKANNKYLKNQNKNEVSSYTAFLDKINFYCNYLMDLNG